VIVDGAEDARSSELHPHGNKQFAPIRAQWRCGSSPKVLPSQWTNPYCNRKSTAPPDHLVRGGEPHGWYGEAQCVEDLEVDHQIKPLRPLYRQVTWLGTMQDFSNVIPAPSKQVG
jgi:hypothetical protein